MGLESIVYSVSLCDHARYSLITFVSRSITRTVHDHYTKLWSQILDSTLWHKDRDVILLWIVMLAKKGRDHIVRTPTPTLATLAKISLDRCRECLKELEAPDPDSTTKTEEGRRIKRVDEGWFVINGEKYQEHLRNEQRREAVARANRAYRARKKGKA
jgi:hypothetical protein